MTDARELTARLGGRWHGRYGTAACPCCQPERRREQDALTLADGDARLLLHCKKAGCSFVEIAAALGLRSGEYRAPDPGEVARRKIEDAAQAAKRKAQALRLWREAVAITGTPAETYLWARGITCDLPETLRFHPGCWHGATAQLLPAMIAAIEGADRAAVHRTWLRPVGSGKAEVEPAKMMLGGALRLTDGPDGLAVAEGIETALSLACGLLRGRPTVWAALSAAGMVALRLPDRPGKLIVATDGDPAGHEAGHRLATRADALGWQVSILPAPEGRDWNDALALKGGAA